MSIKKISSENYSLKEHKVRTPFPLYVAFSGSAHSIHLVKCHLLQEALPD